MVERIAVIGGTSRKSSGRTSLRVAPDADADLALKLLESWPRLEIVRELAWRPRTIADLAERLERTRRAIGYHLGVLDWHGLVRRGDDGLYRTGGGISARSLRFMGEAHLLVTTAAGLTLDFRAPEQELLGPRNGSHSGREHETP